MKTLLTLCVMIVAVVGCAEGTPSEEAPASGDGAAPLVHVTNYPLAYFAARIAGSAVEVRLLAPEGEDPAYWKPGADDVLAMQEADLILLNGASYETWLKSVSLPPSRMVDTTEALHDTLIPLERGATHSHGLEGEHEHSGTAFTTWLDPALAAAQAGAINDALASRWPEHADVFARQLAELTEDLTELDAGLREAVAADPGRPVFFSHPVYEYLERRYGLAARSLHWEPDRVPDETEWQELGAILEDHPASWMIWEDTPLPEVSERLESLGVRSAVFDPCAATPANGDFLSVMQSNLEALRLVYAPSPSD